VAAAGDSRWRAAVGGGGRRSERRATGGSGPRREAAAEAAVDRDGVSHEMQPTGGGASGGVPPPRYVSEPFFSLNCVRPFPLPRSTGYSVGPPTTESVLDDRCHGLRTPVG
jgi:hypothetical protein